MIGVFTDVVSWYMENINYFSITVLMAIESSFIPFPSEVIVPPAAYKAAQGELNIYLVVFFSTLGALIGALFNYYFALWVGRAAIYRLADTRFARLCNIEPKTIQKSEDYFVKNGNISTLIGRLVPVIRQLISLPAGLAKMPMKMFLLYTTIGALLRNILLALVGYFTPKELVELYYEELTWGGVVLGVLFVGYLIYKGFRTKKEKK